MNGNEYRPDDGNGTEYEIDGTFERLKNKKIAKKVGRRFGYVFLTVFLVLLFVAVCMAAFLKIENVEVYGTERYSEKQITDAGGTSIGMNMYAINKKKAAKAITEKYNYVGKVTIRRKLPSTLVYYITEEKAKYYTEICGEYFKLTDDMKVLEKTKDFSEIDINDTILLKTPKISFCLVGEALVFESELTYEYINTFIKGLEENEFSSHLTEIDISNKYNIYVSCENRFRIYLGDSSEIGTKLTFAKTMIDTFPIDQKGEVDAHDVNVGSVVLAS